MHSSCLHTKSSQSDNNFRVPTCLRVQYTFSASVPGFTNNCTNPKKQRKSYLTCLRHCKTVQTPVKNMKTNSQQSFLFRFKIQFKTVSTTYTVQVASNDSLHVPIKRTHNCSSNQHPWLPDASEKSNQRSQTGKHSSLRCQLKVSTPSSTVPSVP